MIHIFHDILFSNFSFQDPKPWSFPVHPFLYFFDGATTQNFWLTLGFVTQSFGIVGIDVLRLGFQVI